VKLLPGEASITTTTFGLALTTHRVIKETAGDENYCAAAFLEHVDLCKVAYSSKPLYLWAAGALAVVALVLLSGRDTYTAAWIVAAAAVLSVFGFIGSRRTLLTIHAGSSGMNAEITGKSYGHAIDFITEVQAAQSARFTLLCAAVKAQWGTP
jgi:hypothetical protein